MTDFFRKISENGLTEIPFFFFLRYLYLFLLICIDISFFKMKDP